MATWALGSLLLGACFGIFLALRHFTHKAMPMGVAILHGLFGATGLVMLLLTVMAEPEFSNTAIALCVLLGAALLGFVNFSFHLRKRQHRSALIVLHALVAVSGAGTLLYAILMS